MNKEIFTQEEAQDKMVEFYPVARAELEKKGLFGKVLDNKSRKLALKMAGVKLFFHTVAWATPEGWGSNGYRDHQFK